MTNLLDQYGFSPQQKRKIQTKAQNWAIKLLTLARYKGIYIEGYKPATREEKGYSTHLLKKGDKFKILAGWKNKRAPIWEVRKTQQHFDSLIVTARSQRSGRLKDFVFLKTDEVKLISHANQP